MIFVDAHFLSHIFCRVLAVSGQHHCAFHSSPFQRVHSLCAVGFYLVVDYDVSGISPVDSHMDDCAGKMAVVPLHIDVGHHLAVAHAYRVPVYGGLHATSGNFFNVGHRASVACLFRECVAQSRADGVGGKVFHMGGEMQQLFLVVVGRMHSLDGKFATCQRACLVKHHCSQPRQCVDVVAAFYQYAFARRSAESAEKCQRHAYYQCAWTRHHQEYQRPVKPCGERVDESR